MNMQHAMQQVMSHLAEIDGRVALLEEEVFEGDAVSPHIEAREVEEEVYALPRNVTTPDPTRDPSSAADGDYEVTGTADPIEGEDQ